MPICNLPAQVVIHRRVGRGIGVAPSARDLAYGPNGRSRHNRLSVAQVAHGIQPEQLDITLTGQDATDPSVRSGVNRGRVTQQAIS